MGERTGIEWTDATWNPWQGCHKVSAGCKNCYMFREKSRYGQVPDVVKRSSAATFNAPTSRKWAEPRKVFVCSWSDFFVEEADPWRGEAWDVMRRASQHTYLVPTKRIERAAQCLPEDWGAGWPNVWLGVSAEDQAAADKRIPLLAQIPAAVRWISAEPLLGPVDLTPYFLCRGNGGTRCPGAARCFACDIRWVVVGGESGPNARAMDPKWVRSLRDQCTSSGAAFFFKQWGEWAPPAAFVPIVGRTYQAFPDHSMWRVGKKAAGSLLDGHEWKEYPR